MVVRGLNKTSGPIAV